MHVTIQMLFVLDKQYGFQLRLRQPLLKRALLNRLRQRRGKLGTKFRVFRVSLVTSAGLEPPPKPETLNPKPSLKMLDTWPLVAWSRRHLFEICVASCVGSWNNNIHTSNSVCCWPAPGSDGFEASAVSVLTACRK